MSQTGWCPDLISKEMTCACHGLLVRQEAQRPEPKQPEKKELLEILRDTLKTFDGDKAEAWHIYWNESFWKNLVEISTSYSKTHFLGLIDEEELATILYQAGLKWNSSLKRSPAFYQAQAVVEYLKDKLI